MEEENRGWLKKTSCPLDWAHGEKRLVDLRRMASPQVKTTGFGHRLPTGNGESAALNCAAHSANYSISCGHPMAEPSTKIG